MKKYFYLPLALFAFLACNRQPKVAEIPFKPYGDSLHLAEEQIIPGRIECEYYNAGGEGLAYHDSDSINSGSGGLNVDDGSYLHQFRMTEAVDISYTKSEGIDNSPFNMIEPELGSLYVGWTVPGEWMKYTVQIEREGNYIVGIMYTANDSGSVSIRLDSTLFSGLLTLPSTYVASDTIAWRQWHHWNYIDSLTTLHLPQGIHTLTFTTETKGNMNYDYLVFR